MPSELQTYGTIFAIVVIASVVLYMLDRRSKSESIVWTDAFKIGGGAATLTGGILYSMLTPESAADVAEPFAMVQDMFVGKPGF